MTPPIPTIVLGGTGYVAGELLRLVAGHPRFELAAVMSDSQPGEPVAKAIAGRVDATFIGPNITRHVAFLATELASTPWFCGDELTIADIHMIYPMEAIAASVPAAPKVLGDWVERAHARPAYKRALERGGPYSVEPA